MIKLKGVTYEKRIKYKRTVTSNQFITACGLEGISLKARKLLYIAISQSKKTDTEFYEYEIGVKEFAD